MSLADRAGWESLLQTAGVIVAAVVVGSVVLVLVLTGLRALLLAVL